MDEEDHPYPQSATADTVSTPRKMFYVFSYCIESFTTYNLLEQCVCRTVLTKIYEVLPQQLNKSCVSVYPHRVSLLQDICTSIRCTHSKRPYFLFPILYELQQISSKLFVCRSFKNSITYRIFFSYTNEIDNLKQEASLWKQQK